ncbi:MAG: matrixin family metalloprotease, partial [Nitrosopumilus sp.]
MAKSSVLIGFVASLLFVSLIAYSLPAFAQGPDNPGKPDVIAVSGIVPGKNLVVHILLEVPPGADRNQAAAAALASQGARAFTAEEYSLTGLVWDQFSDGVPGNDSVIQRYNPQNDPTGGNGLTALLNTHTTWNNVATSSFAFEYGGTTGKCPSLVQECKGRQTFDGNNDVAWLALRDANTLGVTWYSTNTDEADMALNTNFDWATDGVTNFDVETVFLHENGHVAGIGHSEVSGAIM